MATELVKVASPYATTAPAAPAPAAENPGLSLAAPTAGSSAVQIEQAKAQADALARIMSAKNWPRDEAKACDKLLVACQRPSLAEVAVYTYSRGGQEVSGPSIRLAEAAARAWGNVTFGFKVTAVDALKSEVLAYAYDMEANLPIERSFVVSHIRHTKAGDKLLSDPRDIYEKVANEAMRRVRACILECLPGDVIDAAVAQCEQTLRADADVSPAGIQRLVKAFGELGVSRAQLVAKVQRPLENITPAQVVALRKIYASIKDGIGEIKDYFDMNVVDAVASSEDHTSAKPAKPTLAEKAAAKAAAAKAEPAEPVLPQPPSGVAGEEVNPATL